MVHKKVKRKERSLNQSFNAILEDGTITVGGASAIAADSVSVPSWMSTVNMWHRPHESAAEIKARTAADSVLAIPTTINLTSGSYGTKAYKEGLDEIRKARKTPKKQNKRKYIGSAIRFKVLARDKYKCVYCGAKSSEEDIRLEVDHIVPVSKGGGNEMENLTTACRRCNIGKGAKEYEPPEWVGYLKPKPEPESETFDLMSLKPRIISIPPYNPNVIIPTRHLVRQPIDMQMMVESHVKDEWEEWTKPWVDSIRDKSELHAIDLENDPKLTLFREIWTSAYNAKDRLKIAKAYVVWSDFYVALNDVEAYVA